ncbi:MAG: efflux RND transporter periplasmic adaptor subunit [Nitrospira sp.]|jgi:membrane fusion protein (multidrug efflux system)|nr:MAG: efflux RND transporter periplasmic adaptor subunit [Nitrospira sp.]
MKRRSWIGSVLLLGLVVACGVLLAAWKQSALRNNEAASVNQPEPMEVVTAAIAKQLEHRPTTTSIGTVLALRSITLRNELAGTVKQARLTPGHIVDAGALLVMLDVSVEEAELKAQEAQALLAKTVLARRQHLSKDLATAEEEVDRARADLQVAMAQIARTKAIIARKTIRAPFRARVGLADVHPGQYLNEGTQLTTLQGVDEAVHVDFTVAQQVAAGLRVDDTVEVLTAGGSAPIMAKIVALDARVDPTTRNALVRARIERRTDAPAPGASVRVQVPVGAVHKAVTVPASAVRKGPGGDQVFVLMSGEDGKTRAYLRPVGSGAILGDEAVILTGLSAGERVAASGAFKLRDAVLVAIAGAPEARQDQALKQP